MASINKLSVRGIRSFSPEDAEEVLQFYMPLTVIVGANGCGKTTIIESLKFGVCGALPPGKNAGQAFVHDPKSIGSSSVKANLKLRFTNAGGASMVIVRSMEVVQKKTTMSFKQLDGNLRTTDKKGNRISMSHKCSELDRQIPILLGVSKAILENVVFCHQEDASWPLQEGAVLKKKFDDIFDSTRYTKALEVFAKAKKEYVLKAKDHKADVAELKSHKHAAQAFRRELEQFHEQIEDLEEQLNSGTQAIAENKNEIGEVQKKIEIVGAIEHQLNTAQSDRMAEAKDIKTQRRMLKEDLTDQYNEKELNERLETFDAKRESFVEEKLKAEQQYMNIERQIEEIRNSQTELQSKVGRFQAEKESHARNLRLRYERMVGFGKTYGLEEVVTQISQNSQLMIVSAGGGSTQDTSYYSHQHTQGDVSTVFGSPEREGSGQQLQQQLTSSSVEGGAILEISREDMSEYFKAVRRKEEELQNQVNSQKSKMREQEDELNNELSDLKGKVKAIESNSDRLYKEEMAVRQELEEIRKNSQKGPKLRKSNLEDTKKNTETAAKKRDEANADPRRKDIPIEITSLSNKIDVIKIEIENDKAVQKDLRQTLETQSAIEQKKEQCRSELEELNIKVTDYRFQLQAYKIPAPPQTLPGDDIDKRGEELKMIMEKIGDEINVKFDDRERELFNNQDGTRKIQSVIAENKALLKHNLQSSRALRQRLGGLQQSVEKTKQVVEQLRSFEPRELKLPTPVGITETRPDELLSHLTQRLEEIDNESTEGVPPEVVKKVIRKLFKVAQAHGIRNQGNGNLICPCCDRDLNSEKEIRQFEIKMKELASNDKSELIKVDESAQRIKAKYKEWHDIVKRSSRDILEHQRLVKELEELEKNASSLDTCVRERKNELEKIDVVVKRAEVDVKDLRELVDASKIWLDSAMRIALQRDTVHRKEADFRIMNTDGKGRDLKQVEAELLDSSSKKDEYTDKITKLNAELTNINDRVSNCSITATRLENQLRSMEVKYEEELKNEKRKNELNEKYADMKAEQDKISGQIAPLNQRMIQKESLKSRTRKHAQDEDNRISSTLASFKNDVTALQNIVDSIEEYEKSSSQDNIEQIEEENKELIVKSKAKKKELDEMKPQLKKMTDIVDDQKEQKKNLENNINLAISRQKIKSYDEKIAGITAKLSDHDPFDSLNGDKHRLRKRNEGLIANKARLEGRRGEVMDNQRLLKRKLQTREYKNVEEEFRRASIKQDTTEMAVKDIEKYHSALDKALQRYHGLKITDINTIIRDLWTLTYKGEDITNIEIVSGAGNGASSSRSYNYRVVMSKGGSSKMDMRGRCSAGQRVLASIVIRLALAETFCVKFGCIALDEPTVNLDYNNKKGLAIALAQIIASRSQQSNFQLILITHDEDFVLMMKNELQTQSNVSMPEKYFQIRREEGADGKYYSKIDAIDWEELL